MMCEAVGVPGYLSRCAAFRNLRAGYRRFLAPVERASQQDDPDDATFRPPTDGRLNKQLWMHVTERKLVESQRQARRTLALKVGSWRHGDPAGAGGGISVSARSGDPLIHSWRDRDDGKSRDSTAPALGAHHDFVIRGSNQVQRDLLAFDCGERGLSEDDFAVQRGGQRLDRWWTGLVTFEAGFIAAPRPDVEIIGDVVSTSGGGKPRGDPSVSVGTDDDASFVLQILECDRPGRSRGGDGDADHGCDKRPDCQVHMGGKKPRDYRRQAIVGACLIAGLMRSRRRQILQIASSGAIQGRPEEAEMANDDIKTPRPGSDSEEMVGSEGGESDTEFDIEELDDEEFGDERSGDEETETE